MHDAYYLLKIQNIKPIESKNIRLEIYIYPPDKRRRDLDNLCKATQDVLEQAKIIQNDYFIDELFVKRRAVIKGGMLEFIIRALS